MHTRAANWIPDTDRFDQSMTSSESMSARRRKRRALWRTTASTHVSPSRALSISISGCRSCALASPAAARDTSSGALSNAPCATSPRAGDVDRGLVRLPLSVKAVGMPRFPVLLRGLQHGQQRQHVEAHLGSQLGGARACCWLCVSTSSARPLSIRLGVGRRAPRWLRATCATLPRRAPVLFIWMMLNDTRLYSNDLARDNEVIVYWFKL